MKVSVIIPAFNSKEFIKETLESVLSQTYSNVEIIVIDDFSDDNTPEYINDNFSDVRVYKNVGNRGPSFSRIKGVEYSSGELIVFLDSDDVLDSTFIETMVRCYVENEADIVVCDFYNFNSKGRIKKANNVLKKPLMSVNEYVTLLTSGKLIGSCCMRIFSRDLLLGIKSVPRNYSRGEDLIFNIQLCDKVNSIFFTEKKLYGYRDHSNSYSKSDFSLKYEIEFAQYVNDTLISVGFKKNEQMAKSLLVTNMINHIVYNIKNLQITVLNLSALYYVSYSDILKSKNGFCRITFAFIMKLLFGWKSRC